MQHRGKNTLFYFFYCRRMASLLRRNVTLPSLLVRIHQLNILKLTNRRERFISLLVENTATKSPVMVSSFCTWLNISRGHYLCGNSTCRERLCGWKWWCFCSRWINVCRLFAKLSCVPSISLIEKTGCLAEERVISN